MRISSRSAWNAVSVALGNAGQGKLVGLAVGALEGEGVYVGEVIIAGAIVGTPTGTDQGIPASKVADEFWRLYQARTEIRARVS